MHAVSELALLHCWFGDPQLDPASTRGAAPFKGGKVEKTGLDGFCPMTEAASTIHDSAATRPTKVSFAVRKPLFWLWYLGTSGGIPRVNPLASSFSVESCPSNEAKKGVGPSPNCSSHGIFFFGPADDVGLNSRRRWDDVCLALSRVPPFAETITPPPHSFFSHLIRARRQRQCLTTHRAQSTRAIPEHPLTVMPPSPSTHHHHSHHFALERSVRLPNLSAARRSENLGPDARQLSQGARARVTSELTSSRHILVECSTESAIIRLLDSAGRVVFVLLHRVDDG
jgi:hypothetical protein